jgi:8-oxo-dGTP diphosphatase
LPLSPRLQQLRQGRLVLDTAEWVEAGPWSGSENSLMRLRRRRRFAVVQRRKDGSWVLPRGKLKPNERPVVGARREAEEETGTRVTVHEFLGAITYRVRGQAKIVQFWRMDAAARPTWEVSKDIAAVKWLPLAKAVRKLSYPLEKLFLNTVGRRAHTRGAKAKPRRCR